MPRPQSVAQMNRAIVKFNERFPVGAPVLYRSHPVALPTHTNVSEPAFLLGGHTACCFVKHVRGAVAIDALSKPIAGAPK